MITIELEGKTFGSKILITVEMTARGNLYKGEAVRIIEDVADQIAKTNFKCRWEHYEVNQPNDEQK